MGRIGAVTGFESVSEAGEVTAEVVIDIGGGATVTVPGYSTPGVESAPVAGDYAAAVSHRGDSRATVVAYADPVNVREVGDGEAMLYSRDPGTGKRVAVIFAKSDGSIVIETRDAGGAALGKIEMAADGGISVNNGALTVAPI